MSVELVIREGSIAEVVKLAQQIPEFQSSYPPEEYQQRLSNVKHLILIALHEQQPVGFKVGYQSSDHIFYSWMGGVLPQYRQQQVAWRLAQYQEKWAAENGYTHVRFKTRNYLKPMLIFGLKNGFHIIEVIPKASVKDYRIILEKPL